MAKVVDYAQNEYSNAMNFECTKISDGEKIFTRYLQIKEGELVYYENKPPEATKSENKSSKDTTKNVPSKDTTK